MTNAEKFSAELKQLINDKVKIAVVRGVPCNCNDIINCKECQRNGNNDNDDKAMDRLYEFLALVGLGIVLLLCGCSSVRYVPQASTHDTLVKVNTVYKTPSSDEKRPCSAASNANQGKALRASGRRFQFCLRAVRSGFDGR